MKYLLIVDDGMNYNEYNVTSRNILALAKEYGHANPSETIVVYRRVDNGIGYYSLAPLIGAKWDIETRKYIRVSVEK
jgi:hypothetical protein